MQCAAIRRLFPLAALLCLLAARSAVAQDPQLLIGARVTAAPIGLSFVDSSSGISFDDAVTAPLVTQFTGTDWAFFDNGALVVGKDAQPLFAIAHAGTEDLTFFIIHRKLTQFTIDGTVFRDAASKNGSAEVFITQSLDNNRTATTFLRIPLAFTK
jgi:hypothetical protein